VANQISGVPEARPIIGANRQVLCDADMKINSKAYHVWLLSDRLVYASHKGKGVHSYKGEFDLANQTLIRNYVDTKTVSNAFELVRIADQTTALCVTSGPVVKRFWVKAISGAIKEHMRAAARQRQAAAGDVVAPGTPRGARVCEYCRVATPVCKVVFPVYVLLLSLSLMMIIMFSLFLVG
jgi:hypothetical protein